jgi:hypothetical protein
LAGQATSAWRKNPRKDTQVTEWRFERYRDAYLKMARETKYRPGAPSDGWGNILLSREELADSTRLQREAEEYGIDFVKQDDAMVYPMGCPNGAVNQAFFYTIEAARLLCSDYEGNRLAKKLLKMALGQITEAEKDRQI